MRNLRQLEPACARALIQGLLHFKHMALVRGKDFIYLSGGSAGPDPVALLSSGSGAAGSVV